jgi:regulatory protein
MEKKRPRQQKQPRRISRQYLENAALYYLQRYATSAENLRRVLTRKVDRSCAFHKAAPDEFYPLIGELIGRYTASGLLNDAAFAEAKATTLRRQGKSRRAVAAKLQSKGLGAPDIAAALDKTGNTAEDELAAAIAFTKRKKLGPHRPRPLDGPDQARKEMAALGRAGFSYETARAALHYVADEE